MDEVIEINGEKYTRVQPASGNVRIIILQRGWVKVGRYYQDGVACRLENCHTIRKWGTTKGLGEIASNGPTKDTVLDQEPTCRFHEMTVIATIDCEEDKWSKYL